MPWLHLAAVPCGLLLGEAVVCYHFVVRDACKLVHEDYSRFASQTWATLIAAGIVSLLASWCAANLKIGFAGFRWVLSGILTAMTTGLCIVLVFLRKNERRAALGALRKSLGIGKTPILASIEAAD